MQVLAAEHDVLGACIDVDIILADVLTPCMPEGTTPTSHLASIVQFLALATWRQV